MLLINEDGITESTYSVWEIRNYLNKKHLIIIWFTKQIIHNSQEGNTQLVIHIGLIKQFNWPTVNTKKNIPPSNRCSQTIHVKLPVWECKQLSFYSRQIYLLIEICK